MTATPPGSATSTAGSALVVTADPVLLEELSRLAAAAGASPEHAADIGAALPHWSRAALVLIGADQVRQVAMVAPPRRPATYVVSWGPPGDDLFRPALRVSAEAVLELPSEAETLTELLTDLGEDAEGAGLVLGVLGGSGGAGATTFAAALAQVGAASEATALLDLDPLGPGVDSVLGMEERSGVRWGELTTTAGRLGARAFREALPRSGRLGLLTWGRADTRAPIDPAVAREALSAARRGHRLVVLDVPRTSDAAGGELMARCDLLLVVVRATLTGVSAAVRLLERVEDRDRIRVVLRGTKVDPEAVERALGVRVLTVMADQRGLGEAIDLGIGPVRSRRGPLGRAVREVLARCQVQRFAA